MGRADGDPAPTVAARQAGGVKGHCACEATGMSSHAIARALGHCKTGGGKDHPYDPADLRRCVEYCREMGVSTPWLVLNMTLVSRQWAALCPEWGALAALLAEEIAEKTGSAPRTYARMHQLLYGDPA